MLIRNLLGLNPSMSRALGCLIVNNIGDLLL